MIIISIGLLRCKNYWAFQMLNQDTVGKYIAMDSVANETSPAMVILLVNLNATWVKNKTKKNLVKKKNQ